ncbi:glutathione S-transferase family protein [Pelagibacteraceae bacterium]|nr:glutathione S-transferase family protein [Pelagibacteraceae bacterium]
MEKITLGYWSTKGLGSASRQMIIYAGVPLIAKIYKVLPKEENNQIIYEGSSWHDNDKIDLKKKNSLINLPYLKYFKDDKEFIISHSNTCLTFLGKEFGMFGETQEEELECEQLLQETVDLRSIVTRFAYTHFNSKNEELQAAKEVYNIAFENSNSGKLQKFEHWFSSKDKSKTKLFLVGNKISSPDFNLFDTLDLYCEFLLYYNFVENADKNNVFALLKYPLISDFFNNFKQLPKMQKYFESELYKLPFTNKSAKFGSGKSGITWNPSIDTDTTPDEIIVE